MPSSGLLTELSRRNVFKVAIAYLVLGWLLIQVADVLFPALNLPGWSITLVVGLLIIGFIPALIFSWVYELTPEGLKRESEVDRTHSITAETGRRLNLITIGLLVIGICVVFLDHFLLDKTNQETAPVTVDTFSEAPQPKTLTEDESVPFLAVLPFKATGSDDGGFIANGLHDDLLTRLAQLGAFKVISRTSMMEYQDTTKNMRQIGEELGAEYILEGAVQSLGNRIRINAQLIDAINDEHLWANTYDREFTANDLFDIQAEIATAIARQLELSFDDSAQTVMLDVPTTNIDAYTAYLRGLQLAESGDYSINNLLKVVASFEDAVELDPEFALAWAELSRARTNLSRPWVVEDDEQIREQALVALAKARSLKPFLLEAELAWVAYLSTGLHRYGEALDAMENLGSRVDTDARALELKSYLYVWNERWEDAYNTLLKAQRLDPLSPAIASKLVMYSLIVEDCAVTEDHVKEALSLFRNQDKVVSAAAYYEIQCTGDLDRAVDLYRGIDFSDDVQLHNARLTAVWARDYERLLELAEIPLPENRPLNPIFDQIDKYIALHRLKRSQDAGKILSEIQIALSQIDEETISENVFWYARAKAWYHAFKGDAENTISWLETERQNWDTLLKGASFSEQYLWQARILAIAGLEDEAIITLQTLFEEANWHPFVDIDLAPEFDSLRNKPAYIELRETYGKF
jgi:TolB-like protein